METRIFKYPLEVRRLQIVEMPQHADILSVQFRGTQLCAWAMVDPNAPKVAVQIEIYGTGHPIENRIDTEYLGTVQEDKFVWHIFKRIVA